jgi:hypothetical protein
MGTPLTGLEIRDTYDALLKISDNGPLDGTLQTVTDGLGGESALSLSTAGASVTGTFSVSEGATFDTTTLVVDATNNRIGVGTDTPSQSIHTTGSIRIEGAIYDVNNTTGTNGQVLTSTGTTIDWKSLSEITGVDGTGTANYVSKWSDADTITDSQIQDDGTTVGVGQAPDATAKLAVSGAIKSSSPVASSASAWKLGTSNLGGVFVATADYVTVEVNGFIVKLPIAIAPDTQNYYDRVISDGGSFEGVLSYESANYNSKIKLR